MPARAAPPFGGACYIIPGKSLLGASFVPALIAAGSRNPLLSWEKLLMSSRAAENSLLAGNFPRRTARPPAPGEVSARMPALFPIL
jgi:hypothetical protein